MDPRIEILRLTEADIDVAAAILAAAYDNPASSRAAALRRYLTLQPDGWLFALLDGRPVGVGGAVNYGPFASIGSVGVVPRAQRRGVARALMERLLSLLDGAGCPVAVLIATEAGAPLYRRLGFVEDGAALIFRREEIPAPDGAGGQPVGPADMPVASRISALRAEDLPEVARFDAPIFGAARPAVLASHLDDARGRAFVARDGDGRVAGYLVAQEGTRTLGPWAAHTPDVAETLLARALALPFDGPARAIVPSANGAAAALLRRYGFEERAALRQMRRGGDRPPGDPTMLYGRASFAIG